MVPLSAPTGSLPTQHVHVQHVQPSVGINYASQVWALILHTGAFAPIVQSEVSAMHPVSHPLILKLLCAVQPEKNHVHTRPSTDPTCAVQLEKNMHILGERQDSCHRQLESRLVSDTQDLEVQLSEATKQLNSKISAACSQSKEAHQTLHEHFTDQVQSLSLACHSQLEDTDTRCHQHTECASVLTSNSKAA